MNHRNRIAAAAVLVALILASCHSERKLAKHRQYLKETFTSLNATLNDGEVMLLKDSIRVMFPKNVMFDFGNANVRPESMPTLKRFADVLDNYRKTSILVIGRTDSIGGDTGNNQLLSERRADSARAVLHFYGVKNRRMEHWGVGAKDSIATNATEEGRQRNRSVEFIVLFNH